MRKLNRLHTFALSVAMTGLSMMPVWALDGQVNSTLTLETVTCINHTTGESFPGMGQANGFDCSALAPQRGDQIGILLHGTAEEDGGGPCETVQESHPGPGLEEIGELPAGGCIGISGEVGPSDPQDSSTWDIFRLQANTPTDIELALETNSGESSWLLAFGNGREVVHVCEALPCNARVTSNPVDVLVLADRPSDYHVIVKDRGSSLMSAAGKTTSPSLAVGSPYVP